MSSTIEGLERGVAGTEKTLKKMHRLVQLGKLDPTIQKIATWIRLGVPEDTRASTKAVADAIFHWVQKHGLFQPDPFQIEKIEHPIEAMRPIIEARKAGTYKGPALFVGDCDTIAGVYTAALLGVLGFQYAFETAKVDPDRPDEFSHVWIAARVSNEWYPLDPSTKGAYPGWRPPVKPDQFARWPEGPIEDVVKGSDMSAFNSGMGEGEDEVVVDENGNSSPLSNVDAEYAQDYIGYGIPKDFGSGPGVIPPGNFEQLQLLPPHDTQIPAADLERDMHLLKAAPRLDPSERIRRIAGQPDDHGNPYYRGAARQPYIKVERQPYPPGSRWNEPFGKDDIRYQKTDKYIKVKSPETPERRVEVRMDQPMLIRRRTVMTPPQRIPFGAMDGMGDIDPETGIMTMDQPKVATTGPTTTTAAADAGKSVWDSILGAFSSVAKAAGSIVPSVLQSKTAQAVANATNKLAGGTVLTPGELTNPTPWYKNPWIICFGLATVTGLGYVAIKMRPGVSRRRR